MRWRIAHVMFLAFLLAVPYRLHAVTVYFDADGKPIRTEPGPSSSEDKDPENMSPSHEKSGDSVEEMEPSGDKQPAKPGPTDRKNKGKDREKKDGKIIGIWS